MHKWLNSVCKYDDGKQIVVLQVLGGPTVHICLRGKGTLLPGRSNIRVSGLVPLTS